MAPAIIVNFGLAARIGLFLTCDKYTDSYLPRTERQTDEDSNKVRRLGETRGQL